jgi:hypothetical protein
MTLVDFLLARIAEDEALAAPALEMDPAHWCTAGTHIEPERWLAECEAKRRILEEHEHACPTTQALALPYADHPDYDQAWTFTEA